MLTACIPVAILSCQGLSCVSRRAHLTLYPRPPLPNQCPQQELESTINEALDWLDETPEADLEDLEDKKKEVEQIANPIMKDLYQQAPQGGAEEDFDFGDDEL